LDFTKQTNLLISMKRLRQTSMYGGNTSHHLFLLICMVI
jgi:hypothetical protein